MNLSEILDLTDHGPDTFVGSGPRYPWGGLYGGHIVAQALQAAALTVESGYGAHSLRAYFIRSGDHTEPVRYEVDRIRNGRSFCTRRVVARQAVGAILNLEASFQVAEATSDVQLVSAPTHFPRADELVSESWTSVFERCVIPVGRLEPGGAPTTGRSAAWFRVAEPLGDDPLLHQGALVYISDDLPSEAVIRAMPLGREEWSVLEQVMFNASLDHTIWFHRPLQADRWHLYDFRCHTFVGARGLATGHVFDDGGVHVATVAQEVLVRDARDRVAERG